MAESNKNIREGADGIDTYVLYDVVSFLIENEQYGDDWHDEIEELNKTIKFLDELKSK